jgi:hypothetical protein
VLHTHGAVVPGESVLERMGVPQVRTPLGRHGGAA